MTDGQNNHPLSAIRDHITKRWCQNRATNYGPQYRTLYLLQAGNIRLKRIQNWDGPRDIPKQASIHV